MKEADTIHVRRSDLRRLRIPWSILLANKAHEYSVKASGRRIEGQGMIAASHETVRSGFAGLQGTDFARYNLPQAWVECRQIPRVLHKRIPKENAHVLDLGCGPGTSTKLICHFARPSWTIVGYDFIRHYIEEAQRNVETGFYRSREGAVIRPQFVCQDIAQPLILGDWLLADEQFHLALSGGVVGLYLQTSQCRNLVTELRRVVVGGGYIALDAGPSIPETTLRGICEQMGFVLVARAKSFIIEPRPKLIFQKR